MIRWLGVNAALTVAAAVVAFAVVWVAGALGLRAEGVEPLSVGSYLFVLLSSAALMWPVYMAALTFASRSRYFRLWALLLCPLLGLLWFVGNLALTVPEIQAADLFYVGYALVVRPLPKPPEEGHR
jgi:hypothetical protein